MSALVAGEKSGQSAPPPTMPIHLKSLKDYLMIVSPTFVRQVEKITRLATLLWGAMGFSVLVVAAIAFFFQRQGLGSALEGESRFAISLALLVLAVGLALMSLLTRQKIWDLLPLANLLARPTEPEDLLLTRQKGASPDAGLPHDLSKLSAQELRALRLIRSEGMGVALVIWGMSEAPAMLGLVLILMGGDAQCGYGMITLAGLLLLIHRPGFDDLIERIKTVRF